MAAMIVKGEWKFTTMVIGAPCAIMSLDQFEVPPSQDGMEIVPISCLPLVKRQDILYLAILCDLFGMVK